MILFTDSIFVASVRGWCRGFSNNVINRFLSESLLSCPLLSFIGCDSPIPQIVHEQGSFFTGLEWRRRYLSRKTARKTEHNDRVRERLTNLRRNLRKATEAKDAAKATATLKEMYSALDRAAKVGVIHKRAASRRKSRYSKSVKAIVA